MLSILENYHILTYVLYWILLKLLLYERVLSRFVTKFVGSVRQSREICSTLLHPPVSTDSVVSFLSHSFHGDTNSGMV